MARIRLRSVAVASLAALSIFALDACCALPPPTGGQDAGAPDTGGLEAGFPDAMGDAGPGDAGPLMHIRTNGSGIAVTRDETAAVVINRNIGRPGGATIEKYLVMRTSGGPPEFVRRGTMPLREASQVIIGADDNTAFVAGNGGALKIDNLKGTMQIVAPMRGSPGAEPRGIALSPTGKLLYVANWSDGTVSVFYTVDMILKATVDLNPSLASSGVLGEDAAVLRRGGLAHPYAIAVTDDGDEDDDDETVYVTEFFSQARIAGVPNDDSSFDIGRQGIVYRFAVNDERVQPLITITPRFVSDPLLVDANDQTTGCFPNQLNAATVHRGRLYITGVCASPRGPMGPVLQPSTGLPINTQNFKTLAHGAIFVVNTQTNLEEPLEGVLLTREFMRTYEGLGTNDDEARRMPLIPNDIAFLRDGYTAYITAYGADALFRVDFNADGSLQRVGSELHNFIDLGADLPTDGRPGTLPWGLVFAPVIQDLLYVVNEHSRSITAVSFPGERIVATAELANADTTGGEGEINDGRRDFVTGLGRWSHRGQAWSSCESCHPGGLTDGVTWFTSRGPRQTISLDSTFHPTNPAVQRLLMWTANGDEIHDFELFTRDVSGGVGAIVHLAPDNRAPALSDRIHFTGSSSTPPGQVPTNLRQDWLNGTAAGMMPGGSVLQQSVLRDWNYINSYVQSIRTPRAPSNTDLAEVQFGRQIFQDHGCAACHAGPQWTISTRFYGPGDMANNPVTGSLVTTDYVAGMMFPAALNPPTRAGMRTAKLRSADPFNAEVLCALRAVGTYPAMLDAQLNGVAPAGVKVREARDDMTTPAAGANGFNVPSLLGLATSAPYFHAGNARTLEEVFGEEFAAHHGTISPEFPGTGGNRAILIGQLVQFLMSIDDNTMMIMVPPPQTLGFDATLCPDSL